jgi:hypothetical protein
MTLDNAEEMGFRAMRVPESSRTPLITALAILYKRYEELKEEVEVCEQSGMRSL